MAISRERLEELIEQKKTIYIVFADSSNIGKLNSSEYDFKIDEDYFRIKVKIKPDLSNYFGTEPKYDDEIYLTDTFETKEDAEEFLKYGNITKIFKFPFVSYNDFLSGKTIEIENVVSVSKATKFDCIVICDRVKGKQQIIDYATRENYHKALDICVKLWRGEE